ncbi:MAG: PAS domain S-box protein [Armatimonadetes bacterium]|nr:PAS domain S-box protein [Armatimonadota bacterium]
MSLRIRLLLLIFFAFLPVLALILYTASEWRQLAAVEANENTFRLLRSTSAEYERLIDGARQLLIVLAQLPAVRANDSAASSAIFAYLVAKDPTYANIGTVDPTGEGIANAIPGPVVVAARTRQRLWFQRAIKTRDFAIGEYQIGQVTRKATINAAYPVFDEAGSIQAIVLAAIDLSWLNQIAARARLPQGSTLTLIDSKGVTLVRYPDPQRWVGRSISGTALGKTILTQGTGVTEAVGRDGVRRMYAFIPLGEQAQAPGAYVSLGIPKDIVFAKAYAMLTRNLILLGLVAALALLAAWVGGDLFVTRRIDALERAAKQLSGGELSARTGLQHGPDELGRLAATFDEMAVSIEQLTHLNQLILDSAGEGIYGLDRDGNAIFINPAGAQMLGWSIEEIIGRRLHDLIHHTKPDGTPYPIEECPTYAAIRDGIECRLMDEILWRKDGTSFPVEYVTTPIREYGELIGAAVVFRDITERKQAEENLRKTSRMLRMLSGVNQALIRATSEFALLQDACRVIVEVGDYRMSWIGFAEHDEAKIVRPVAHAGYEEGYLNTVKISWKVSELGQGPAGTAIRTGKPAFVQNILTDPLYAPWREEAGKRGYVSSIAVPLIANSQVFGAVCLYTGKPETLIPEEVKLLTELADDLSYGIMSLRTRAERRRALEALQESEERFRLVAENATDAIITIDEESTISFANRAAEEIFGYTTAEMLGKQVTMLMPEHLRQDHFAGVKRYLKTGKRRLSWESVEFPGRHKSGKEIDLEISYSEYIKDGKHIFIGILRDITERKRLEEHKRDFYRRTILAATEGKLMICERDEIERIAGPPETSWVVSRAEDLGVLRRKIAEMALSAGMEKSRVDGFVLCVGEALTNAIKHAGGGKASLHRVTDGLMFLVSDEGPGIEALALPEVALKTGYSTAKSLGMGYKAMISIGDQVYLATGPGGTTVAVEMKLQPVERASLLSSLPDTWS